MTRVHNTSKPKHSTGCFHAIFALARKRLTLIFRKVADVRREKELAERRKNEPQLDQAQDHLVRKIFSRFKSDGESQIGMTRTVSGRSQQDSDEELTVNVLPPWPSFRFRRERQHTADVEKGDGKDAKDGETSHVKKPSTAEEGGTTVTKTRPGKWGRLLGSSSVDSGSESGTAGDAFKRSLSARDSRPSSSAGTNKIFPKLGKLGGTIEEGGDNVENPKDAQQQQTQQQQQTLGVDSKQLQLRRLESYDGGLITQQPSHEREILAAVLEVKVDLKLEVQRVNQRLAKIEDMLQALMNKLPASATSPSGGNSGGSQQQKLPSFTLSGVQSQPPVTPSVVTLVQSATQTTECRPSIATTSTSTTPSEGYREQSTATERMSKSGQEHHHHHHHHHQSSSSRDVNKELLERLAQASTSRGDDSNALGPHILRKRRSKSRNKGAAPLAPLATQPMSPSEATETTQMLECTDDRDSSGGPTDRTVADRTAERSDRKRPPPRPREYL